MLHYGRPGTLDELVPGMTFTIEPMINAGRREIKEMGDGWTIVTKDRSLSAQWEHTILVTDTGYEVLTVGRQPAAARRHHQRRHRRVNADHARRRTAAPAVPQGKPRPDRRLPGRPPPHRSSRLLRHAGRCCGRHAAPGLGRSRACPPGACLAAVGGYGRGELFPHSDVDVLVLLPDGIDSSSPADGARRGGTLHHHLLGRGPGDRLQVRTVPECVAEATGDVTIQTALLEYRFSRRCAPVPPPRQAPGTRPWTPRPSCAPRPWRCRQRHTKFDDTPYALEPNCKESPGGLRDLQVLIWLARAAGPGQEPGKSSASAA